MFMFTRQQRSRSRVPPTGLVAALDVGTTKVCCLIAKIGSGGSITVTGIGHHLSRGIKAGAVVDMDATEDSIRAAVHAAEKMSGEKDLDAAFVNLSAGHQHSQTIGVEVAVTGTKVTDSDVHRAIEQAMIRTDVAGREVIHAIPLQYSIDGATGISEPRGMFGSKLGVHLHVVTADASQVRNLAICVGRGHLEVRGPVSSGYASALATLVDDERALGATVIDMGGGVTNIAVFSEGGPVLIDSVTLGGQHVTNDIARGLGTSMQHAERLKTLYGSAVENPGDDRELIDVPLIGEVARSGGNPVPRAELGRIVRPRIEELFEHVRERLNASGCDEVAGRRVVLTGGASLLDGVGDVAARILEKQIRPGRPLGVDGMAESMAGPAFATAAGMLLYAARGLAESDVGSLGGAAMLGDKGGSTLARVGRWLRANL